MKALPDPNVLFAEWAKLMSKRDWAKPGVTELYNAVIELLMRIASAGIGGCGSTSRLTLFQVPQARRIVARRLRQAINERSGYCFNSESLQPV
jgi:hypothetical protein